MPPASNPRPESDHRGIMIAALIMILVGWLGLYQVVMNTLPLAFPRWLFFILLFVAITGTAMPFVRYLNIRFTPALQPAPAASVILRQSIWFGLYAVTCAWLQIPRVLSWPVAFFLALSFVVIEVYLRLRERADHSDL
jgi:hypothetical protein